MAARTPPRSSVDHERMDMRITPTPASRYRPSYIPLPGSISASPGVASTTLIPSSISNGNGVVRSGSALQYNRPSDSSLSRTSVDDARTGRSSSLSLTARSASPAPVTLIQPPSSSSTMLRSSLMSSSDHSSAPTHGNGHHQRTYSINGFGVSSNTSNSSNASGPTDTTTAAFNTATETTRHRASSTNTGSAIADDCDDEERILPVKVAVRVRPLTVDSGDAASNGWPLHARGSLTSCLEVLPNASIVVSSAAANSGLMGHVGLSSAHNSLSYHGVSTGGDEVSGLNGFARHSTNGSSLGGAVAAASSVNGNNTTSAAPRNFHFDYVFGPDSKQTSVYDTAIAPLLSRFVEGYNVTVLAYGQTSSGKTFTMGTEAEDTSLLSHADTVSESTGIVPRALGWLFLWASQQQSGPGIDIRVSFIEVHNEELIDLVSRKKYQGISPPIFIREDTKGNILWNGAEEIPVADTRGALSLLVSGSQQRRTGSTNMNEKSSRSHAIYRITLTQTKTRTRSSSVAADGSADSIKEQVKVVSKLHFVDLAGSERLKRTKATAERQREGISINSGLLALGNVISALGDPQRSSHSFVPYRDSKLTHMLRDSLGGSAQTLLIACVSAAESNLHETINTLKYAARARNIKNRGGVNMESMGRLSAKQCESLLAQVRNLKREVRILSEKLQALEAPSRDSTLHGSAVNLPMLGLSQSGLISAGMARSSITSPQMRPSNGVTNGDATLPETPSKIPTMNVALQKRAQTAEELNILKARNQALESELEQLNDTYTELLLKFNDACREIEEKQNESFDRDQKLRDREQEIRRLTGHSRHDRRVVSSFAESIDNSSGTRPTSVADTLRQKRRSVRLSMSNRSISEGERLDAISERVHSVIEEDAPPMPDMTRLRHLRSTSGVSIPRVSQTNSSSAHGSLTIINTADNKSPDEADGTADADADADENGDGPGAAEFDAILEEYDASVRALEDELKSAREAIEGLKLQLSMQETKATFAEKLNVSQLAQIEAMRVQLAKAREAGQEEEQKRRAIEAELEEAAFNAETQIETVMNEWRLEMQSVDEQWRERWDAAHLEYAKELEEQRNEISRLRNDLKSEASKNLQLMSPPPTAHDIQSEQKYHVNGQKPQQYASGPTVADREENERLNARIQQLEAELEQSMSQTHGLETEVETLKNRSLDAEARASAAEDALAALSAKMAVQKDESSQGNSSGPLSPTTLPSYSRSFSDLPRRTSDKIILCARNSMAQKNDVGVNGDASATSAAAEMSSSEQRLRSMRGHRYSTAVPVNAVNAVTPVDSSADKFASYPELRLASSHTSQSTKEAGFGPNGRPLPIYDEDQIQKMLREAAAEVEQETNFDKEKRQLKTEIAALKDAKKELQERNSQMQNLMRDLSDRLVRLAEENDMLEAEANERSALAQEVERLTKLISEYEKRIVALQKSSRSVGKEVGSSSEEKKPKRPHSLEVARPVVNESSVRASAPGSIQSAANSAEDAVDAANFELIQLQSKLNIVEAELTEAVLAAGEHQTTADTLAQQVEKCRIRISDLESDLESAMMELDIARDESQRLITQLQKQAADSENEAKSQKSLVSCLRETLTASEQHMEEAKLASDRFANELMRVQSEAKVLHKQLDEARQQLDDAHGMAMSEARDRDIWKGRCQDLREEVDELRARRRHSKMLCF